MILSPLVVTLPLDQHTRPRAPNVLEIRNGYCSGAYWETENKTTNTFEWLGLLQSGPRFKVLIVFNIELRVILTFITKTT